MRADVINPKDSQSVGGHSDHADNSRNRLSADADFDSARERASGTTPGDSSNKARPDPTQGQLEFARKLADAGFHDNGEGSYAIDHDGKHYEINYFTADGKPVTNPDDLDDESVKPSVRDGRGNVVTDAGLTQAIADEARNLRDLTRFSDELSKLPLDATQAKAFEGITQAMAKTPPDLDAMNQIAKQFSVDPTQFKNVASAIFYEHELDNPNRVNFMENGVDPGKDITFTSPQPGPAADWTNVQLNIPKDFYKTMYGY